MNTENKEYKTPIYVRRCLERYRNKPDNKIKLNERSKQYYANKKNNPEFQELMRERALAYKARIRLQKKQEQETNNLILGI